MLERRWQGGCRILVVVAVMALVGPGSAAPRGDGADGISGALVATVRRAPELGSEPLSGRLLLLLDPNAEAEPLFGPGGQTPFFTRTVSGWHGDEALVLDGRTTAAFTGSLDRLAAGTYAVRAVLDQDPDDWSATLTPGNVYSAKGVVTIRAGEPATFELTLEHRVELPLFEETALVREVRLRSERVSAHLGIDAWLSAAVILPPSYATDSERRYPTVYVLPGWGASRHDVLRGDFQQRRYGMTGFGEEKVFVFLDHSMRAGYHCFADSEVAGPWGSALVEELIPYLERTYRLLPERRGRFLSGQSSGGWGALWLQINFAKVFAAAFAASPDFVDFRAFGHGLDLYASGSNANFFTTVGGADRPVQRWDGEPVLTARDAWRLEALLGGGQLHSFEAVFSPPDGDRRARALFDRASGVIDPVTVAHWRRYDLSRTLRELWPAQGRLLDGRLFIAVSAADDYYLDEPVRLLAGELERLGAHATIEIVSTPGHDVWSDELRRRMHETIDALSCDAVAPPADADDEAPPAALG